MILHHHLSMVSYLLVFYLPVLFNANRGEQWIFLGGNGDSGFNWWGRAVVAEEATGAEILVEVGCTLFCTHRASSCVPPTVGDGVCVELHR